MWFCRENDKENLEYCLQFQPYDNPTPLKYGCTAGDCGYDDNATTLTMSYTIRNGSEEDSDRYFCVTGTSDECFVQSPNRAMKVSFTGRSC